ncbi:YHYH protein [Saprospiraceae bacterium]|nr:YHYH protein [Saprospiraceae bacterium]
MKKNLSIISLVTMVSFSFLCCSIKSDKNSNSKQDMPSVDVSHFATQKSTFEIKTIDCTLSDGTKTKCYEFTTKGLIPQDHDLGPWCVDNISDGPDKAGYWFKDGELYSADGEFIKNLATFYNDDEWKLYNDDGTVRKTKTKEDCMQLQGAQLVDDFLNYCIECLPEYTQDISRSYTIPINPVRLDEPINLGGGRPGGQRPPRGERPKGPPPGGKGGGRQGPTIRGIALNGVAFDAPAPLHIILAGYTIPPIDQAGGHINLDAGYHYHAATGIPMEVKQNDGHAPLIGYAMDGYGLYGLLDDNGSEPQDLDACRGHYDDVRGYHYHVDAPGSNNFINCFSGAVAN